MKKIILLTLLTSLSIFAKSQTQLITNGSFSSGWSGWGLTANFWATTTFTNCQICPGYAYAGASNGTSLIYNQEYLTQTLTVPSNTTSATLTYYTSATLSGASSGNERLYVYIYDWTAGSTATFANVYFSTTVGYNLYSLALPSSTFGHSIEVGFRAESPSIASTIRVDEVSLLANISTCTPATISTQPINQTSTTGSTASFNINATGTAPITYQWYKNSTLISGATNSTYTTPILALADNGNTYYCNVTNCSGTTNFNSNSATLTVTSSCTGATITSQPTNQSSTTGNTAMFSVIANGTAPITYQWYKNSTLISGANSSSYTTPTLTLSDNGNTYYCIVTNCSGTTNINSNSATLTVTSSCTGATITSQPTNQSSTTGNTAMFSVIANGTAPIAYQWYKNSTLIPGANSSSYTTPTLTLSDNGNTYYCIVTNCNGTTSINSNSATLTVTNTTNTNPDLIIQSPTKNISQLVPNASTTVTYTIKNQGLSLSNNSITSFFLSTDNVYNSGIDTWIKDDYVPSIASTSSTNRTITVTIPNGVIAGTYYIIIITDAPNSILEVDETNNTSFVDVTVSSSIPCTTDNYPWMPYPSTYNLCNTGNNYSNWGSDNWAFWKYQCTSFTAWKVNEFHGITSLTISANDYPFFNSMYGTGADNSCTISGSPSTHKLSNACFWDDVFLANGITVNSIPSVGSIAHWNPSINGAGSVGHVGFVNSVNGNIVCYTNYNGWDNGVFKPCEFGSNQVDISQPYSTSNPKPEQYIHVEVSGLGAVTSILDASLKENAFFISPNPTSGILNLQIQNITELNFGSIHIYNSLGQEVLNWKLTNKEKYELDLNILPIGFYFIQLKSEKINVSKKFILER